jgi:Na+/proline symporter
MAGMLVGFLVNLYIWLSTVVPGNLPLGSFTRRVPWTWYVTIGACLTFTVGYAASKANDKLKMKT